MPTMFDPRRMFRTPGFAPDGLYDDEQEPLPPLPDRIVPREQQQSNMGLSGMIAAAPAQIDPVREIPQERPQTDMMRPPQRERITLPSAPLPPKVGKMRQVLGHAAAVFLPQLGTEIVAPGHTRAYREWEQNNKRLMNEAEINAKAAQEEASTAAAMANMSRSEASKAQRLRTLGLMEGDNYRNVAPNAAVVDFRTGSTIATNHLPLPPTVPLGPDGRLKIPPEGISVPASVALGSLNNSQRHDPKITAALQLVDLKMPNATPEEKRAAVVKLLEDDQALGKRKTEAEITRASRPYAGRNTGLTPTGELAETRRQVDSRAKEFIQEKGGLDAAISDLSSWSTRDDKAEQVLSYLKAMKGGQLAKSKPDAWADLEAVIGGGGKAPTANTPKPPAQKPAAPKSKYKVGETRSHEGSVYRFDGSKWVEKK